MQNFDYTIVYEYFNDEEVEAWARLGFLELMAKFKLAVAGVKFRQNHVGDITLAVHYKYSRSRPR